METPPIAVDKPVIVLLQENPLFIEASLQAPFVETLLDGLARHHRETFNHSIRVTQVATSLGQALGLMHEELLILIRAGLLHDIGKAKIPVEVLDKTGRLDPVTEKPLLDAHPRIAFETLREIDPEVARVIVGHHEHQMNAYPRAERRPEANGTRILLLQEMLALADQTDALMSKRAYKPAYSKAEAAGLLLHFPTSWVQIATVAREKHDVSR